LAGKAGLRDNQGRFRDQNDGRKGLRVKIHLFVGQLVGRERTRSPEQDRVAVGRRLGDGRCADISGRAGTVLDHELLAELGAQFLRDGASERVGRAAGREGDHHRDRTRGPCFGFRVYRCA
jgi:hypothetical protein